MKYEISEKLRDFILPILENSKGLPFTHKEIKGFIMELQEGIEEEPKETDNGSGN